jgi:hypothetical protein
MISNAAQIKKLNKSQRVVKEGSEKRTDKFRIGVVPYFGQATQLFKESN